jgi:hypothetical protein
MMSNLPDDWSVYGGTCSDCGYYYHMSGTDECKCVFCERFEECGNLEWQDGYCSSCHETKDHIECYECGDRHDPYDMHTEDEGKLCGECWDYRLTELLSSKRVRWKKIVDLGYCLYTIMEQAQKDGNYALGNRAASAVYNHYRKE